jgi:hypothetical protein
MKPFSILILLVNIVVVPYAILTEGMKAITLFSMLTLSVAVYAVYIIFFTDLYNSPKESKSD